MTLLAEIQAKCTPELIASRDDKAILAVVNAGRTALKDRRVNAATILSELPIAGPVQGGVVLDKLEAAGAQVPACKWASRLLLTEIGINVGDPNTQAMLDALAAGSVLTQAEAAALKALAVQPDPLTLDQVSRALNGEAD